MRSKAPGALVRPTDSLSSRYELLGRLGTGGMAEVHLARAIGIDDFEKIVVLKRVLPGRGDDPRFVAMLRDEARVAATLEHPNIVSTHDIGVAQGEYFFTMEYLHGENVKAILKATRKAKEKLPLELAMQIAIGCAAGLHHAHEQTDYSGQPLRIVHRDVSPSNIFVTRQSGVKLIDFGIAKATSGKEVTAVGMVKGKAAYMSPEQCRAEKLDRRSDIFSLGICLYEMVTMKRPFDAELELPIMNKILTEDPVPPRELRDDCPPAVERIIVRALQRDRDARYQSAFDMLEELELATRDCGLLALPGALGRYLEHLFGPKPHPWTQHAKVPPAPPRWAWTQMDSATISKVRTDPKGDEESVARRGDTAPTNGSTTHGPPSAGSRQTVDPEAADLPAPGLFAATDVQMVTQRSPAQPLPNVSDEADKQGSRSPMVMSATAMAIGAAAVGAILFARASTTSQPSEVASPDSKSPAAQAPPSSRHGEAFAGSLRRPSPPASEATPAVQPATNHQAPAPSDSESIDGSPRPSDPSSDTAAPPLDSSLSRLEEPPASQVDPDTDVEAPGHERSNAERRSEREARRRRAAELIERAHTLLTSDPSLAFELTSRALRLDRSQDGYALLGLLGCRLGRPKAAQRAYRALRGARKKDLQTVCDRHGIPL